MSQSGVLLEQDLRTKGAIASEARNGLALIPVGITVLKEIQCGLDENTHQQLYNPAYRCLGGGQCLMPECCQHKILKCIYTTTNLPESGQIMRAKCFSYLQGTSKHGGGRINTKRSLAEFR